MTPDFKGTYRIANEDVLLASHVITHLPVDVEAHIRDETDIALCSYEKARKWGLDLSVFGSEDATLTEKSGKHIIFFNASVALPRMLWSITHEMGHFYLGHELCSEKLSKERYDVQEIEANFFAAQVLMPDQIIHELAMRGERATARSLMKWFHVSHQAASKRLETINRQNGSRNHDVSNDYSEEVLLKFATSVDKIRPKHAAGSLYTDLEEDEIQNERNEWMYDW